MQIKIKKTIETEEIIELNLPAYFTKYEGVFGDYLMICENENVIVVNGVAVMILDTKYFSENMSRYSPTTEEAFFEAYNRRLDNIQNSVMPLPVI